MASKVDKREGESAQTCGAKVSGLGQLMLARKEPRKDVDMWGVEPLQIDLKDSCHQCDAFQRVVIKSPTMAIDADGLRTRFLDWARSLIPGLCMEVKRGYVILGLDDPRKLIMSMPGTKGLEFLEGVKKHQEQRTHGIQGWWLSCFYLLQDGSERGLEGKTVVDIAKDWTKWPAFEMTKDGLEKLCDQAGPTHSARLIRMADWSAPTFDGIPLWRTDRVPFISHEMLFPKGVPIRSLPTTGRWRIKLLTYP
jgi:hypothetical protein